jgi:hypothetical protein
MTLWRQGTPIAQGLTIMRDTIPSKPELLDDDEIPPFEAKDQGAEDERYDNIPCTD